MDCYKKRKAWREGLGLVFLLCLLLLPQQCFARDRITRTVQMKSAGSATWSSTVKVGNQDYIFHKITIDQDAIVRFTGQSTGKDGNKYGIFGRLVKSKDDLAASGTSGKSSPLNSAKHEDIYYGVKAGTYYFRVAVTGMAGYRYQLKAKVYETTARALSSGAPTRSEAKMVRPGSKVTGMVWNDAFSKNRAKVSYRWYRLSVKKGEPVTVWYWDSGKLENPYFVSSVELKYTARTVKKNGLSGRAVTLRASESGSCWIKIKVRKDEKVKIYQLNVE